MTPSVVLVVVHITHLLQSSFYFFSASALPPPSRLRWPSYAPPLQVFSSVTWIQCSLNTNVTKLSIRIPLSLYFIFSTWHSLLFHLSIIQFSPYSIGPTMNSRPYSIMTVCHLALLVALQHVTQLVTNIPSHSIQPFIHLFLIIFFYSRFTTATLSVTKIPSFTQTINHSLPYSPICFNGLYMYGFDDEYFNFFKWK